MVRTFTEVIMVCSNWEQSDLQLWGLSSPDVRLYDENKMLVSLSREKCTSLVMRTGWEKQAASFISARCGC